MGEVLLILQLFIALALIGVVLIQRSDQDGMGLSGSSSSSFMTGRGAANLLTRTTAILATLFMLNCLVLGIMANQQHKESFADKAAAAAEAVQQPEEETTPAEKEAAPKETEAGEKAQQKDSKKLQDAPAVPLAE